MRIIFGQMWFEANTFNPISTTLDDFRLQGLYFGADMLEKLKGVGEIGGAIAAAGKDPDPIILIPTLRALAMPGGPVERSAFDYIRDHLLEGIQKAGQIDGVLLSLHGAMSAEGVDDCEGTLLSEVRNLIGSKIPITVTLDLHANITPAIMTNSDLVVGYHTCPHDDIFETGYTAASLLFDIVRGDIKPAVGWRKIPMIVPAEKMLTAEKGPFARLFDRVGEIESQKEVVSASLFSVQPWLDIHELGSATMVFTNDKPELAQQFADELAKMQWGYRHDLLVEKPPVTEAVKTALASSARTVILVDGSDATVGGAPGDSTVLLQAFLQLNVQAPIFLPIIDPEAVQKASVAGLNSRISLEVGGKRDSVFSRPVSVQGEVIRLTDGRAVIEGPVMRGVTIDMGRIAVLKIGGIHVVLTEKNYPGHDPSLYRSAGLDPEAAKIVVVKSAAHFRSNYAHITREYIYPDSIGMCTSNFSLLPYKRVPRPIFPLDKELKFEI